MSEDYDYYGDDYDDTIDDEDEDTLTDLNKIKDSTKELVNFKLVHIHTYIFVYNHKYLS